MKTYKKYYRMIFFFLFLLTQHCGEAGTRIQNPPSVPTVTTNKAYPTSFAITSPLKNIENTSPSLNLVSNPLLATNSFDLTTTEITSILNGTSLSQCNFDPAELLTDTTNANCYGPNINYTNHPDGPLPNSGQLPGGDVGLWTENNINTDEACSAAQLNARIDGVANKANIALKALASLLCVANVTGVDLPSNGASIDVVNDMMATNATFNQANLSLNIDANTNEEVYSYQLNFDYLSNNQTVPVLIKMEHRYRETDNSSYRGKISFQFGLTNHFKCNNTVSTAGSILYQRESATSLLFDTSHAVYCNQVAEITTSAFTEDNLLDPTAVFSNTNTTGWQDNYTRFMANFNPSTLVGDFAFAWQAGAMDSHSRVFNLNITNDNNSTTGNAFYGFGPAVPQTNFDGRISGFICNWAGPGNSHTLQNLIQYQSLTQNDDGLFIAASSDIIYAPTNSCAYQAPSNNQFQFDFDSNNDSQIDQNDPTANLNHDLRVVQDSDGDGYLDEIQASGFVLPQLSVF